MAKILIVDDDKDILKFTDALLSQSGHEVKITVDPLSAIELLNSRTFDLLITDANMPHYTGFELIKTVRSNNRYKNLGIAMLTGMREKASIEKAIKVGVDDYIVKPIDSMVFMKKIEELLTKKPPQKQLELTFSSQSKLASSQILFESKVQSISEYGMKILSPFEIPNGCHLSLQTYIFAQADIEPPVLKILSSEKIENEYIHQVGFMGLSEMDSEKLRSWLQNETNKRKLKVA